MPAASWKRSRVSTLRAFAVAVEADERLREHRVAGDAQGVGPGRVPAAVGGIGEHGPAGPVVGRLGRQPAGGGGLGEVAAAVVPEAGGHAALDRAVVGVDGDGRLLVRAVAGVVGDLRARPQGGGVERPPVLRLRAIDAGEGVVMPSLVDVEVFDLQFVEDVDAVAVVSGRREHPAEVVVLQQRRRAVDVIEFGLERRRDVGRPRVPVVLRGRPRSSVVLDVAGLDQRRAVPPVVADAGDA